ncbi:flavodoxin family protein [Streptomyces sp. NPDC088348]|uniref:flavodoxin family protein n=1 Tax=Streptomyces sp. NPDC088348 TaxID=3365853 RepID=UPI003806523C
MLSPRVAVVYHSRHGTLRELARAAAEGAAARGARVRLAGVEDSEAPARAQAWPERSAGPDDVLWADGLVLATPTYFGNVSSPFKRFLESTNSLWTQGRLTDRVVTGMTASSCTHGGREATLLALYQTVYHWGSWVLGPDPAGPDFVALGANPYGLSADRHRDGTVGARERAAAWSLGGYLADTAARSRPGPTASPGRRRRARVTVVHCAEDWGTRCLAQEAAAGARDLGARVRLRRVAGPNAAGASARPGPDGAPASAAVTASDVAWADAVMFGAPSLLGTMDASLLGFVQSLAPAAGSGPLVTKPAGAFVTTEHRHAGSESALLSFHRLLQHCGALVVPPGYTDPAVFAAGGNPYGTSHPRSAGAAPTAEVLAAVRHQGRRMAMAADRMRPREALEDNGSQEGPHVDHATV